MRILSDLLLQGSVLVLHSELDFPLNPKQGQFCFSGGILYIYATVDSVTTWFPLTNKVNYYVHAQGVANATWTVTHNLATTDLIFMIYDHMGEVQFASNVTFTDGSSLTLDFSIPVKGKAIIFSANGGITGAGSSRTEAGYGLQKSDNTLSIDQVVVATLGIDGTLEQNVVWGHIEDVPPEIMAHLSDINNPHSVTADQVGLGNVTNDAQVKRSEMGVANGVATLDASGMVPASITGNAATATVLETARNIGISGDVSGSASFNGSQDISIVATIADNSHAHTISNVTGLQDALDSKTGTEAIEKIGDDIIFKGNLIPSQDSVFSIGAPDKKIAEFYVSANTIYLGENTTLEGTYIVVDAGANPTSLSDSPTIVASRLIAKPFTYNPGGGSVTVRPSIEFQDISGNSYPISFDTVNNKFSLDALGNYGQGTLVCKNIEASGTVSLVSLTTQTDVTVTRNLRVDGNATLGYDAASVITIRGSVDLQTPITFGQAATLGDGNDTITINCGMANNLLVTSKNLLLDTSGNLSVIGTMSATGGFSGNAATATKLQNSRIIALTGDVTGSVDFDGSQNVNITTVVANDSHSHSDYLLLSGGTVSGDLVVTGNVTVSGTYTAVDSTNLTITDNIITLNKDEVGAGVTLGTSGLEIERGTVTNAMLLWDESTDRWKAGILGSEQNIVLANDTIANATTAANCTGNAATATKLATPRTISLSGGVTGSTSFDGSANVSISATIVDDSHSHSDYSLVDGSRAFTGTVAGITPVLAAHLSTKGYVDNAVIDGGTF